MESRLTAEIVAALAAPFPIATVEVKPGAVRQDGTSALALAYADWRVYADRLDAAVGPANWSIQLVPWDTTRVIARLTILGVTKDASGEGESQDENCGTIAEAQAKKRACAEFGLGRYFYALPKVWGKGQGDRKSFRFDDPQGIVYQMYQQSGLMQRTPVAAPAPTPTPTPAPAPRQAPTPAPVQNGHQPQRNGVTPDPARLATARAALEQAEQQHTSTAVLDVPLATDKQRGAISALIARCAEFGVNPHQVDRLGNQVSVTRLSSIRRTTHLPATLTKQQASTLIGELDTLVKSASA
jgi:hypothetical protein